MPRVGLFAGAWCWCLDLESSDVIQSQTPHSALATLDLKSWTTSKKIRSMPLYFMIENKRSSIKIKIAFAARENDHGAK